jgi:hypothetical protein
MSIQLVKARKFHNKVLDKTGLSRVVDWVTLQPQKLKRKFSTTNAKVYYHYHSRYTHPHIKDRMYGENAPVQWQTYESATLAHFLQRPESVSKPYLIEPNDHILTMGHMFGAQKPSELIRRIDDIKEIISSSNFRGFLLGADGLIDQFKYYFGDQDSSKVKFYPQGRSLPKIDLDWWAMKKSSKLESNINFICLAGDYRIRAVDMLIESWLSINHLNGAKLLLVCANIPDQMLRLLSTIRSIKVIPKAPISSSLKASLLSTADVSIALTHIDGGANIIEGMEYGHPIITSTSHRSIYIEKSQNGKIINFPNEYYKMGRYGVTYDGWDEYLQLVEKDDRAGLYEGAKRELASAIKSYIESPEQLLDHSYKTLLAISEQSVCKSNIALREIYMNAIKNQYH